MSRVTCDGADLLMQSHLPSLAGEGKHVPRIWRRFSPHEAAAGLDALIAWRS
jgi:hypothetical protein